MTTRTDRSNASPLGLFTRNRHLLVLTVLLLIVGGLSALTALPRIEDPRITTRNATIITAFPGASAARVESLVSKKLEDRLRELAEIKTIESTSRDAISIVAIELHDWVDADHNEQIFTKVRDRLDDAARDLPPGAGKPLFDDKRGAVAYSLVVALAWQRPGEPQLGILNRVAEQLGDRLRGLPGTEQVVLFGAPREEIQVAVDAERLAALGISTGELADRVAAADARRSAGTLRGTRQNLPLELTGALDSTARVAAVPLAQGAGGRLVALGDVATVRKQWRDPPEQVALHGGQRSILVAVRTGQAIRLDDWATRARDAVTGFAAESDPAIALTTVFDQSRYTSARLGSLAGNLLAGALVIMLVVLLTMGWRAALIVGSAVPLSAGATLFGLTFFGEQIHQMSIFGMIIAIGLLIDNAIVMTDAVMARRRSGAPPVAASVAAIRHLFAPLLASTLTTILGFMPVFLLPGNVGDFVGPIAIAVVLALSASFALSMTVVPALAALLAHAERPGGRRWWRDGVASASLGSAYRGILFGALRRPLLAIAATATLPALGFVLAGTLGMQFFPPADRDQVEIQVWMPPGTAIGHTVARLRDIEQAVRRDGDVVGLTWVAGASSPPVYYNQLREQDNNPAYARGVVRVRDTAAAKRLEAGLQAQLDAGFRDARIVVRAFGQGPPVTAPVGFRIVGPDPDRLRLLGEQLRALLHEHPAVTHTQASIGGATPKLWLDTDERRARLVGLTLGEIANQFQAALDGRIGGRVLEDLEDLPVRIRYAADDRAAVHQLDGLRLKVPGSVDWVPAAALGETRLRPETGSVTRRNGERVNEIHGYLRQGALPIEVTRAVQGHIDRGAIPLPPGYRIEQAGDSAEQQQAVGQLLTYVPVLATLMVATLVLSFRSFVLAGLIGLVGICSVGLGMLSLWAGGYPLGFNPIIGNAGLVGVAINGCIVVLAAIRGNPAARAGDHAAIVAETLGATRHIVSTTLTTVAGFLPLLLLTGGDFWPPLAVVIAGGVGLSGLLSLCFTPAAYRLLIAWRTRLRAVRAAAGPPRAAAAGSVGQA